MLRKTFNIVGRNARILIATEALWSIPMNWVFFYRPIFLSLVIGLSSTEIGLLITVFNLFSVILPLLGGYLADRFGRKKVFMLFDSVFWLSSLSIWIISRNIWHALLAYILESFVSLVYSVWECLLVEDTKPEFRSFIYGSISAIYTVGSLTTPVAGYIISLYGLDMGCRTLFALALCSLMPMFLIRQIYLRESALGQEMMRDEKFSGLNGYINSISLVKKNTILLALFLILVIVGFYNASYAYISLYLVDKRSLGLNEDVASLMPSAYSISSLLLSLTIVPKLSSRSGYLKVLISGYSLGCLAILLLINSPPSSLSLILLSGILLGFYSTAAFSVSRTFLTNQIEVVDSRARAKILSMTVMLSSLMNLPTPTIAGYLFSLDPRLPFIAILTTLLISLIILVNLLRKERRI